MRDKPLSMLEQSELIEELIGRCTMRNGAFSQETVLVINGPTVDDLAHLASRLRRMSHHQTRIEKMVMGK
ncbi:hypothetical protein [Agrobacterium sp. NPDC090273]|uniref:hypothetical protein n=1 Tax=Agrobacterium sp. NPDC090273 TaxID=3363919 RepID=UPI00383B2310